MDDATEPQHYTECAIQPLIYIWANELDFLEGNIVKYVSRHRKKNGKEDLLKAQFYLNKLIELDYPDDVERIQPASD